MSKLPDFEALAIFAKVVELRSFAAAATELALSKATVSKAVTRLEQRLGARLFNRTSRRLALTDAGQKLAAHAARLLADGEAVENEALSQSSAPRGVVRLAVPMTFGVKAVAPLLPEFLEAYPDIRLEITAEDNFVDLLAAGADAGIRYDERLEQDMIAVRVGEDSEPTVVGSPDYLARHGTPKHPQDLREHASLTYGFLLTGNQWKLIGADGDHWIQPAWSLCVNNAEVLRDVAIKGRGLALLPEFIAADALKRGDLRAVLENYSAPPLALYAVYPPTRHLSVKVRLFIDFLVERFGREDEAGGRRSRG